MLGLKWGDVDFKRRQLTVVEAVWEGKRSEDNGRERVTDILKGGRSRVIPLTSSLSDAPPEEPSSPRRARALRERRQASGYHLRDLSRRPNGVQGSAHRGPPYPSPHVLLASRDAGGAGEAIQELAGHADLATTMRYMQRKPSTSDVWK